MGELPSGGGTNSNSQDDNLSLEQALLAALLATGTASVVGARVAESKEKRQQAVKAENQANDKANQQKIAQAEKVKQDDQAYAKSMVGQLQQHGQFWLSAALVSVLGIGVCAYLLSNPQYDHLPIAYDCEMGLVQHVVPLTGTTIVQYPSTGTKNPFIGANPFVMIAVLGLVGKLLETAGRVIKTGTSIQKATGLSPIVAGAIGAVLVGAGVLGNMILQHADPAILAPYIEQAYPHVGFTSDQTADEFIEKYRRQEPCLLVQAIPTDDPNIFEFIAHPFNVPEGYRIEWYKGTELQGCQGNSCRIQFESGEHHVKARLIVDTYETSVTLSRTYVEITPETSQLETCQIQYIAHISASEASYTSPAGIAAIVLSQINHYNQPHPYNNPPEPINNLYGFKVALDYVNEARAPLGLPLISEAQQKELAYSEYKSDCEKGIISAPRNDPNNGFEYDIALRMVTLMSQDLDNPLGRFNHNLFGISDNDFELLKYIKDNVNYTQEKGIQISREVVDEWYNRYQTARQGFIPEWWPPDPSKDHPLIFWNDDGASVMIHTDASADAPLNWYCPQDLSIANLNLALVYQDHTSEIHCEFCTSGTGIRATNPDYFRGCTRLGTNIIVEWINADTLIERIPTSTPIYEGE